MSEIKVTRIQAIQFLDSALEMTSGFDDYWTDLADRMGLYDHNTDEWPTFNDLLKSLGVTDEEIKEAKV